MSQLTEQRSNEIQSQSSVIDILSQHDGIDVWGILARRKWLVILGLILGAGLGYVYLLQADPVFESMGQVLIEERKPPSMAIAGMGSQFGFASDEAKHAHMMLSPIILADAYDEYGFEKLPTFADKDDGLMLLGKNLAVDLVEEGTNILNVRFRGPNPDDTQKVVNDLLSTYEKFLEKTNKDTGDETRQLFVDANEKLQKELSDLERERSKLKATTPLMWKGPNSINMYQDRQIKYESERVLLKNQLTELQSKIQAVKDTIGAGEDLEPVLILAERDGARMFNERTSYSQELQRQKYVSLLMRVEELLLRYGPDHPEVVSVRAQIRRFAEFYPEFEEGSSPARHSSGDVTTFVANYVRSLEQRRVQLENQISALDQLFNDEEMASKELQAHQAEDERLRYDIERKNELFSVTVNSLEEISLVQNYEGFTYERLAEAAVGSQIAPNALKILPISGILGVLVGFGIAYLVDLSDKAFRTPDEVSQVMQVPVIGHIPLIDLANQRLLPGSKISPAIVTVHRPRSPQAESYRAVRTALYFNYQEHRHQVIQMTSPMPGDGKSTLGSNLAVTIAQSGKRVLLMDADFRRPSLHRVFGLENLDVGLASVVGGMAEPEDAIRTLAEAPNLSLMPCGPRPSNPSELLSSEQFENLLGVLRQQFDFVIVDTPPVLAVSDPCAVAARVDGVILTFRIHKRARPLATRAREALSNIGAPLIGVVVNGVDHDAGGYYSQYRYGYSGYRYSYGNQYGYGAYGGEQQETQAIKTYFDDDGTPNSLGMQPEEHVNATHHDL